MKHKLIGIRENNNNEANIIGLEILKNRVMSVVTRMWNTNLTIIVESPNIEKTNHSNSPMRSIFSKNSKKEQNLEHRPKEPDQQSMRTCSSVANLDRLYDYPVFL